MKTDWTTRDLSRVIVVCDDRVDRRTCDNVQGMLRLSAEIDVGPERALEIAERYLRKRGVRMSLDHGPAGAFVRLTAS